MKTLSLLFLLLSGCTYATGSIKPDGSMSFYMVRPWLEKRQMQMSYDPATKEVHIAFDTEAQHLPWKDIGALLGTSVGEAVKAALKP